jgi:hypothetical protein
MYVLHDDGRPMLMLGDKQRRWAGDSGPCAWRQWSSNVCAW